MVKIEFLTRPFFVGDINEKLHGISILEFIVSDTKYARHRGLPVDVVRGVECASEFAHCAKVEIYTRASAASSVIAALSTNIGHRSIAETMIVSAIDATFEIGLASDGDHTEVAA
ncbi:hypothetical protein [Rhizobium sp. 2MFCol3.1]|uniref:hypothetical protein n=1 Tax=Rhizobium sp. 2MFCol3.1 TaxID=1246459 RepID=UPI00035EE191|nr:hypothetical protein [Rhizobium sp. 2MFCol3.1]